MLVGHPNQFGCEETRHINLSLSEGVPCSVLRPTAETEGRAACWKEDRRCGPVHRPSPLHTISAVVSTRRRGSSRLSLGEAGRMRPWFGDECEEQPANDWRDADPPGSRLLGFRSRVVWSQRCRCRPRLGGTEAAGGIKRPISRPASSFSTSRDEMTVRMSCRAAASLRVACGRAKGSYYATAKLRWGSGGTPSGPWRRMQQLVS